MAIEWAVVGEVAKIVGSAVAGVLIKDGLERKPKLVTFYGAVSTHRVHPTGQPTTQIHTHEVVVRNVGKKPAKGVRMQHAVLPNFHVMPPVQHTVESTPGGSFDIVFPTLVPGEQVTVSYLYFPPLLASGVNTGVKHDEGFAVHVQVLLQRQFSRPVLACFVVLQLLGLGTLAYLLITAAAKLLAHI